MEYRNLGRSGLKVSPICLGTMMFGGQTDETTAQRIADRGRDAGVNFIDTADAYNHGASEQITGRLIAKDRNSWVLATKVANPMGPMWFGEEPTVERSCAVDPTGPSSAIVHPITAVRSSADRITDRTVYLAYAHQKARLPGLSSAGRYHSEGPQADPPPRPEGARSDPLSPRRRKEASLTVGNLSRRRVLNGLRDPRLFAPTWPGDASLRPLAGPFLLCPGRAATHVLRWPRRCAWLPLE